MMGGSTLIDRIDGLEGDMAIKVPVRVGTLGNVTLSGLQTIDGVALAANDRVLVKSQSNAVQNGIYTAQVTAWVREPDFDGARDATTGTLVFQYAGSTKAATWWAVTTAMPFTPGIDAVNFTQTTLAFTVVQATETTAGIAQIATEAETEAGAIDTDMVTPLKLKTALPILATAQGINPNGKHMVPITAGAMQAATTNGAMLTPFESTTNKINYRAYAFDQTTQEFVWFTLPMPFSWNEGTLSFRAIWTAAGGTPGQGIVWELRGVAFGDGEVIDVAPGSAQQVVDVLIATGDVHITVESGAITLSGTPGARDITMLRFARVPADASDNLASDGLLLSVDLFMTTDTAVDQ